MVRNAHWPQGIPTGPSDVLICFAVKEEAKFFHLTPSEVDDSIAVLITGMGRKNAAKQIRDALPLVQPKLVLTCGFAGGLNPELKLGSVIFDEDFEAGLGSVLTEYGCVSGTFYCSRRVAVTAREKQELWQTTGSDAVEMESSVIRTICKEFRVPSATIRVISDTADQDLPLDFNALMTSEDEINYGRLAWAVMTSPGKIPKLIDFQRETVVAAQCLANVLLKLARAGIC